MIKYLYSKYSKYNKLKESKRVVTKMNNFSYLFNPIKVIEKKDFFKTIEEMGVKSSDNILIRLNSEFSSYYNKGLLKFYQDLFDYVDIDGGNVLSLSYTFDRSPLMYLSQNPMFHKNVPTTIGLTNEIFRRMKGVQRSIHATHSVSVYGKDSREITSSHHLNPYTYSDKSPFYHISGSDRGKEIIIGLNHYSINQHYIEKKIESFGFIDNLVASRVEIDGKEDIIPIQVDNPFVKKLCKYNDEVCKHSLFNSGVLQQRFINGISIYVYDSKKHAESLVNFRKQDICNYHDLKLKTFLLNKIAKPIVLKSFFNSKNGILYPKKGK